MKPLDLHHGWKQLGCTRGILTCNHNIMSIPGFLPSNILNNGQEDHAGKVQFSGHGSNAGANTLWSADNRGDVQGLNSGFEIPLPASDANATKTAPPQPQALPQSYLDIANLTMAKDKYSVLLPTYNERRNLPIITFVVWPTLAPFIWLIVTGGFSRRRSQSTTSTGN